MSVVGMDVTKIWEVDKRKGVDQVTRDDCKFYLRGKCTALRELYCRNEDCSFYKPREDNDTDMGKDEHDDRGSGRIL